MQGKLNFKINTERGVGPGITIVTSTKSAVKVNAYSESALARELFKQMAFRFQLPPKRINMLTYTGTTEELGHTVVVRCDILVASNKIRRNLLRVIAAFIDHWHVRGVAVDSILNDAKPIK